MNCYVCGHLIHPADNIRLDEKGLSRHASCEEKVIQQPKPPLGLMPHNIWVAKRMSEIMRAIIRYEDAGKEIPWGWGDELKDHLNASQRGLSH